MKMSINNSNKGGGKEQSSVRTCSSEIPIIMMTQQTKKKKRRKVRTFLERFLGTSTEDNNNSRRGVLRMKSNDTVDSIVSVVSDISDINNNDYRQFRNNKRNNNKNLVSPSCSRNNSYHSIISEEEIRKEVEANTLTAQSAASSSSSSSSHTLNDFDRYRMLGEGSFGQVWLVSYKQPQQEEEHEHEQQEEKNNGKHHYALKILSKYELIQKKLANTMIRNCQIMDELKNHPMLCGSISHFHDTHFCYILMPAILGGDLYTVMNNINSNNSDHFRDNTNHKSHLNYNNSNKKMSERDAIFYCTCIIEALTYMHQRGIIYRDVKPTNILLNYTDGYPVIVDFGFAKYLPSTRDSKTYSTCGTPLYMAPEIIACIGHNYNVDHWSYGCLIYEMLEGHTPFYDKCNTDHQMMSQHELLSRVVKGIYTMPQKISKEANSIIKGLLTLDPEKRLGNNIKGNGCHDVLYHPWLFSGQNNNDKTINYRNSILRKEITAPMLPSSVRKNKSFSSLDYDDGDRNFVCDKTQLKYPELSTSQANVFASF